MVREIPLAQLLQQFEAHPEEFATRHPHAWLVWEAGSWELPDSMGGSMARTRLPVQELEDCLPVADAVCFELAPEEGNVLRLGRMPGNDLVVADATVSREHLRLIRDSQGSWSVQLLSRNKAKVGAAILDSGQSARLEDGDWLQAGRVRLTFHTPAGLRARLGREAERLKKRSAPVAQGS